MLSHLGWRHAKVTQQRTKADFAACMRDLVDVYFPHADRIHVVLDNLSTHSFAALYDAFPPDQALRLKRKLVFHYTPKHASWLNMVEIELSVLVKQCLNRRLSDIDTLRAHVDAWQMHRNAAHATVHWQSGIETARAKLARLYPSNLLWWTTSMTVTETACKISMLFKHLDDLLSLTTTILLDRGYMTMQF